MRKIFSLFFLLCFFSLEGKERICLNMIVKNESHVIAQALTSVKAIIDYWVIVDTGSKDGTQEVIKETLHDIPGELFERPWVDFGHNRDEALQLAKEKADYILFLDADDELCFLEELPPLTADCYEIKWVHNGDSLSYFKPQIVKASLPWHWKGVLHEYLTCNQPHSRDRLQCVQYIYGGRGARSQDPEKYVKAANILERALKDEPENSRYVFYFAESLKDTGKLDEAIVQYEKRAAMGGWEEEVYWSLLQVAILKERLLRSEEELIESFYRAHRARPHRIEAIYYLSQIFNRQKKFPLAYATIKGWQTIVQPEHEDILFKMDWVEKWGLPMQHSLAAYYLGKYDEFESVCDALLARADLPEGYRKQVLINKGFLVKNSAGQQNAETLYHLALRYRGLKIYSMAYECAKKAFEQASASNLPKILWEVSLAAYNLGHFGEAVELGQQYLLLDGIDEGSRKTFMRNLYYYISGIYAFAHAEKYWGLPPWETGRENPPQEQKPQEPSATTRLHICTMASEIKPALEQLATSCRFHGHHLDIVGLHEPFSFGKKLRDYKKYIDTIADDDVVLCVDGYDVLVLADEKTLLDRFYSLGASIVFGAETVCHPYPHLAKYYPETNSKFKYLNSGTFMGYAGALKKMLATGDKVADEIEDQGLMEVYFLYHKGAILLDYDAKIFLTLLDVDPQDIEYHEDRKNITYCPQKSSPLIVHGNSTGKRLYQEIYDRLFRLM